MDLGSPDFLMLGCIWYLVFIFSLTLHEAAHAWAAKLLGDPTAYYGGQVTLNPLPHIQREPVGTIAVPAFSYLMSGWVMGWASAPYDPAWASRYPRRAAWMAAAGPAANLLIVLVAGAIIRIGLYYDVFVAAAEFRFPNVAESAEGVAPQWGELVSIAFTLNYILLVFNLIPLPPLDGSAILQLFMSRETAQRWQQTMSQPQLALLGLIGAWVVFRYISPKLHIVALNAIYPDFGYVPIG